MDAPDLKTITGRTLFILMFALLLSCTDSRISGPDSVIFDSDPREKDISFKPTEDQIEKAEIKLLEYLEARSAHNQTIFVTVLDKQIPLQDDLQYYKRRYFGRTSIEGDKIIKIELVFVRCGGQEGWKKLEYTNLNTKECWWSVQYDIDHDEIYDLKL